jgi:hypothetical protein
VNSYTVYSDGWGRRPTAIADTHEATLRVLKDGVPFDGVRARISITDAMQCDQHAGYADPFWDALLVLAAREAEARIRHGDQPSRSPDGPVILPSYQLAASAVEQAAPAVPATTELLSFGVE